MDLVVKAQVLPRPGQTILGTGFSMVPGGKGANQAVAVSKLGIPTFMVGRVGDDQFGAAARTSLAAAGADTENVIVDTAHHTGIALITVADTAENLITVAPGANGAVGAEDFSRLKALFPDIAFLLLQLEFDAEIVTAAARAAQQAGITVVLDPAPACDTIPDELFRVVDIITPNETEASILVDYPVNDSASASAAAEELRARGPETVIVKLGANGIVYTSGTGTRHVPAYTVDAVDTVAAGDAFNGGLTAGLCNKQPLEIAIQLGTAAAALAVTRPGAQDAMPTMEEVERFMRNERKSPGTYQS